MALARHLLETRDEIIDALIAIERREIGSVRFGSSPLTDPGLFRSFCALHKNLLPACPVKPTHGDAAQLAEEVVEGIVDAALVTLPLEHPELHIEQVRSDRLLACLRKDSILAEKVMLQANDLRNNLTVLYHPHRHPAAHARLLELLADVGIEVNDYSRASHPSEMQTLVKDGHGVTLLREGTPLDGELVTRPIANVDWTVDTAVIYHKQRHPKTLPPLVRNLKRLFGYDPRAAATTSASQSDQTDQSIPKRPPQTSTEEPIQLTLLSGKSLIL